MIKKKYCDVPMLFEERNIEKKIHFLNFWILKHPGIVGWYFDQILEYGRNFIQ